MSFATEIPTNLQKNLNRNIPQLALAVSKLKELMLCKSLQKFWTKSGDEGFNSSDVNVARNYGETASEKVSELLTHLLVAIIAVTI